MALPDVPAQSAATLPPGVLRALAGEADLLGTWWAPAVLTAGAVGLGALWGLRRARSRRAWSSAVASLLLLALAACAGVNARTGYFSSTGALVSWVSGRVVDTTGRVAAVSVPLRPGSGLARSTTYVYTPPGYDAVDGPSGRVRYPVVYLFHGTPGTSRDWVSAGQAAQTADVLIARHLIPPVLLVAPDLNGPSNGDTECLDSTRPGGPQVETHVADVVRWVDAHYATAADPEHRVAAGMSMGGYCALDQTLRHQDVFGGVIGLEPFSDPGEGGRDMLVDEAQFAAVSPSAYLGRLVWARRTPVFLDLAAGGDPEAARDVDAVSGEIAAAGQPVLLRREPGTRHSWAMARTGAPYGLVWVLAQMGLSPAAGRAAAQALSAPPGAPGALPVPGG